MIRPLNDDVVTEDKVGEFDVRYMHGTQNRLIRYYYYINSGLGILNQFRNLVLGIFALYVILHLTNPLLIVLMFALSCPILALVGYYEIHTMSKVMEWIGIRFSSHYAIRQFNYQQAIYNTLIDIKKGMVPSPYEALPPEETIDYFDY